MRKDIIRSAITIVASTAVLGLAYPVLMVLIGQVAFSSQANGSLITMNGKLVGSKLAGQSFGGAREDAYFQERPSAVAYNAAGTSFSNLGPNSKVLANDVNQRI